MYKLYANIDNVYNPISVTVSENHSASTSTLITECVNHSLNIGDYITADIGYEDNHSVIFTGYVKQIDRKIPNNTYTITANDIMIRAVDYFIVSSNPDEPFRRENILAENLIEDLMNLAGLDNFYAEQTNFRLAIDSVAEVNLVSAYDYSSNIADLLAWHLYADGDTIKFINRKPYVMNDDTSILTLATNNFLSFTLRTSEKELRNRVVVYGSTGIYAEAKRATSYNPLTNSYEQILPTEPETYYKSAVAASPLITVENLAEDAAEYNLELYNRLGVYIQGSIIGNPLVRARKVVTVNETLTQTYGDFYVFMAEHVWDRNGYIVNLELRK